VSASYVKGLQVPEPVHNEARLLTTAAILAEAFSLERWRVLAFGYAYACLNASWWLQLGGHEVVARMRTVADIIEPHLEPRVA
jgi:streptomycin 6-kinase